MGNDCTKSNENIYFRCRKEAAKYNDKLNSREGASELLGVSVSSLADYELGNTKIEVSMMRLWEDMMVTLRASLKPAFISVTYLNPETNQQTTKTMYCSSVTHGLQIYDKFRKKTYYEGASFSLTER